MSPPTVIIFGPTGDVGSAAARTAASLGARVVLAMRDVSKPIPGLDAATERQGKFERVTADLTKPDTVRDAVSKTGATRAFFYLQFGAEDHMRATVEALKQGGVELPVFLSSFTVHGNFADVDPNDMIASAHTQTEQQLTDVFGAANYVALRPGWFATNTLSWYGKAIQRRELKVWMPDTVFDGIATEDIGRVAGTILANGPQDDQRAIYLYGPKVRSHLDIVKTVIRELEIDATTQVIEDANEAVDFFAANGFPRPFAEILVASVARTVDADLYMFGHPVNKADFGNIEKYSGQKATTFEEWIQANRAKLLSS